jgi:hypothetical protein
MAARPLTPGTERHELTLGSVENRARFNSRRARLWPRLLQDPEL